MKRALPVLVLTVAGLIPVWRYAPPQQASSSPDGAVAAPSPSTPAPPSSSSSSSSSSSPAAAAVVAGPTVATEKGDVQVEVTFEGERIASVRMLRQPNHPQTTNAVPVLIEETLEAQSADIDSVTGATVTSEGYKESLQAALDARGA
ncbi:FMN-binding protein [Streptomyces glaucescens]|uniref:FMN-binding protein n=1 Tax=Streptomyces glaucescens TaxID=1907 RepID=A0A089XIV4_STRGA|nr:FMN-binding protein [Streptomyces glaucescens]AIS01140.1 FMN-binding protein [Streptomyces glaucescens]